MERKLETIMTKDDKGTLCKIDKYQEFYDATSMADSSRKWLAGLERYETVNGEPVNRIDDDTFELVSSGARLTRIPEN